MTRTTSTSTLRRIFGRGLGAGLVAVLALGSGRAYARHAPPPAVIPTAETKQAEDLYKAGRYQDAVTAAKAALTKNERYTPAMLVMAKAFFKLHKYEWMKKLWEMMQANGASNAEKGEIYQLLAFLEIDQKNVPGAIALLKQAAEAKPDDAIIWNNLGAQYLEAKNYTEATPVLEKAATLQPGFAKAHLNLGDAYRGDKEYEKAQAEYQKALQLFPNYADAVFNLGILYLDADKIPNMDLFAKENTAIQYLQKYKQMMGSALAATDPADSYIAEAQEKISREEKRLERIKKQQERDAARAAKKAADDAKKAAAAAAAGQPGAPGAPGAAPPGPGAPGAPGPAPAGAVPAGKPAPAGAVPAGKSVPASAAPAGKPAPDGAPAPGAKATKAATPPAETPPAAAPAPAGGKPK
jgi:tetratricopeptide (TPR) repeat protein